MNPSSPGWLTTWVAFLLVLLCRFAGQTFLKAGLQRVGSFEPRERMVTKFMAGCAREPRMWVGVAVVGLGFLGWLVVLSRMDIGQAMPLLGLTYIPWVLIGWFFFDEQLTLERVVGVVLIAIGVMLVTASGRPG